MVKKITLNYFILTMIKQIALCIMKSKMIKMKELYQIFSKYSNLCLQYIIYN